MNQTATKKCFQKYTAYKDSGIPWLGKIPEHWEATRLGTRFNERKTKVSDKDFPPLSVTKSGTIPQLENAAKSKDGDNRKLVKKGDFVINSRSDRKGSSGIAFQDGSVSLIYIVLEPLNIHPIFCNYLLKSFVFIEEFYREGRGIVADLWTTRYDQMKLIMIALPPLPEQTAIANFLDDKTAKIDKAVSIIEKQISLLKERKQILIHELVTGKLVWNPDTKTWTKPAEVKDSGVEWIGEIPKHWVASKFKHYIKLRHGHQFLDGDFKSEGVQVVKISQLHKDGYLDLKNASRVSEGMLFKYSDILIKENDVLMCLTGGTIGKIIKVGKVDHPLLQNYRVGHFSTVNIKDLIPDYILPLMSSDYFQCQIFLELGETGQPNIGMEDLNNMMIVVPSTYEQQQIAFRIESTSQKIDQAISLKEREIEKLKEYKTSLINSVVTGKVRVN